MCPAEDFRVGKAPRIDGKEGVQYRHVAESICLCLGKGEARGRSIKDIWAPLNTAQHGASFQPCAKFSGTEILFFHGKFGCLISGNGEPWEQYSHLASVFYLHVCAISLLLMTVKKEGEKSLESGFVSEAPLGSRRRKQPSL